ncbi:hypothetical protein MUK42_23136 [Musa troglodytarum]|uniref:Uncharacterized protein n=1 Tax=Musa troglodytarum TaxID=320322 RepID=A0A9E7FKM7_9LILI|nr:hypothetical protein MUK42_23136 [Musa troglodytarum]
MLMESIDIACKDAVNGMPSRRPIVEMMIPSVLDRIISPPVINGTNINKAPVAQWIERLFPKQKVVAQPTFCIGFKASICINGVKNMAFARINMHPFPTAKLMALEANMTFF